MHIISTRSSATGCGIAQRLKAESAPRHPRVSLGSNVRLSSHTSYRGSLLIQGTMRFKSAKPAPTKKTGASPRLALLPAGVNIPLAEKAATGGEDALMMCPNPSGGGSVAVADGVGSWNDKGVNPGAYSRALMHFSREMFREELAEAERPAGLLQRVQALLRLRKECTPRSVIANAISKAKVPGSATIAVASLNADQGLLETAYIGDAGVMVVRGDEVLFKSDQQQYEFDMPYQVACRAFVDMDYNSAADAQVEQIQVQRGDLIILASDGLFDNLFDAEILQLKREVLATDNIRTGNAYTRAEALARAFATQAAKFSTDRFRMVPYAVAWSKDERGSTSTKIPKFISPAYLGGKPDDITVVVAEVVGVTRKNKLAFAKSNAASEVYAMKTKSIALTALAENRGKGGKR